MVSIARTFSSPLAVSVLFLLSVAGCATTQMSSSSSGPAGLQDALWVREELYFGSDIPTGGTVTDSLWEIFVNEEIVSRFPDGFTTVPAIGHYKYRTGEIMKEPTRVIIIYYPSRSGDAAAKLDTVISTYKDMFSQESVLRVKVPVHAKFQ